MADRSSEQTARDLVDSFNREIARGGTGDETREMARDIGGESVRESEILTRRRTGTVQRPVQTPTPSPSPESPSRVEVTLTREGAVPTSEAAEIIARSQAERTAARQRDLILDYASRRGLTEDRLERAYQAELLRQRREQDLGDLTEEDRELAREQASKDVRRQQIREQVAEQVISDVEPGLRRERPDLFGVRDTTVIGGVVDVDRGPRFDITRPSAFFFEQASRFRRRGVVAEDTGRPFRAAGLGSLAFVTSGAGVPFFAGELAVRSFVDPSGVRRDIINLPRAMSSAASEIGPSLTRSPITSGSEILSGVVGPSLLVRGTQTVSGGLARFRSDFIPVTEVTSGRSFTVTREGVTFRPQVTERVLFNVPVGDGTQTLILRGGVMTTAEDLATQVARAGVVGEPVSAQVGIVPFGVQAGRVPLREATALETAFFVDPASRVRLSRAGLTPESPSPLASSDVRFTLFGTRPQVLAFGEQRFAQFPSDIQRFVTRDPSGRTWSAAERARLESWQLQAGQDRFTVPGYVSIESEAITTARALDVTRVGTAVIEGRRVPLFGAELVPGVTTTPSPTLVTRPRTVVSPDTAFIPVGTIALRAAGVVSPGVSPTRSFLDDVRSTVRSEPFRSDFRPFTSPSIQTTSDFTLTSFEPTSVSLSTSPSRGVSPSPGISTPTSPSVPFTPPSTPFLPTTPSVPFTPGRPPPSIPRTPGIPTTPITPGIPGQARRDLDDNGRREEEEFVLEVRRGGVFKPVTVTGSREAAISLGVQKVSGTLAASFRVRRQDGELVDLEDLEEFTGGRFRPGRTERGVAVERRRFRLGTGSEVREIQSARRNIGGL